MNLNLDIVPSTLNEAVSLLKEALSESETERIKKVSVSQLHLSLGQFIRNEWSLWNDKNVLNIWFKKTYKIKHADDISSIILDCLLKDLNNQPRRDVVLANEFVEHWETHNKKLKKKKGE